MTLCMQSVTPMWSVVFGWGVVVAWVTAPKNPSLTPGGHPQVDGNWRKVCLVLCVCACVCVRACVCVCVFGITNGDTVCRTHCGHQEIMDHCQTLHLHEHYTKNTCLSLGY